MLRLRACIASHLLSSPSTSAISTLRRLISAAAPAISPHPGFAVEDYLVSTCGLSRSQALKASTKLSHLKSSANPDAVLGLSSTAVAALVARDPKFLCANIEKTLTPNFVELTGLGLSPPHITPLLSLAPWHFRSSSIVSNLHYYLSLFGSSGYLLRVLERGSYFVGADLDKVVKPNVLFLQECGLGTCDIAKLCLLASRMLSTKPESVRAMAAFAEGIGVPRGSRMFRQALQAFAFLSEEKIAAKVDFLKKTFRWSDVEVSIAVRKAPDLLRKSDDMLRRKCEFLISEVGLEPVYIAHRSVIINYSMEGQLKPRYYVLKFLKANGMVDQNLDYYNIVNVSEQAFVKKFICPHKEAAPHLAEDYEAACKGEVPTRFRLTWTSYKAMKVGKW